MRNRIINELIKLIFSVIILAITSGLNIHAQIKIESDGDIGIGTSTPTADVDIYSSDVRFTFPNPSIPYIQVFPYYGTTPTIAPSVTNTGYLGRYDRQFYYAYFKYGKVDAETVTSDIRLKKNIKDIDTDWAISIISQLNPIKYDMIEDMSKFDEKQKKQVEKASKDNYGFSAQDVETLLPEIVFTEDDSMGTKSINYIALVPILVKAVQEQQKLIEELKLEDKEKEEQLKSLGISELKSLTVSGVSLSQNYPNPFNENTTISLSLPSEVSNAMLSIYDSMSFS